MEPVGFKQFWARFTDGFLQNRLSYAILTGDNTELRKSKGYNNFRQLIKATLHALECIHSKCTNTSPTCFGTPWVPSSGSLHVV